MSYLIERLLATNETNRIPVDYLHPFLVLWIMGEEDQAGIVAEFELTQDEESELATLLATAPAVLTGLTGLLAPLEPLAKAPQYDWSMRIRSVLVANEMDASGYQTAAEIRAVLGLPDPEA